MKDQKLDKSKICRHRRIAVEDPGEEIVISGIAGRYPDSNNVKHLQENLLNKVDLISDDDRRWKLDHPEIPQRTGKIWNVEKFDSLFFGVHFKQAHTMDPMCRMLLEHTYEAVVDAGINPRKLRGTKTGVFIGACFSESEKTWFYEKLQVNGFGITGCSRAMLANRISYWLGINGPSYTVDSACSSSLYAMEHAYRAIRDGHCDAAIVGGANLCLHPYVSLQFSRLGVLSPQGKCKSFDADANGYTRSEAINVVFLQKAKDAKRIYATYIHGKTNCDGFKEQGITFPSAVMQKELLREFYEEIQISPLSLNFIEAHGTGTRVGDPEELNALDMIFCTGRNTPLPIGSVKSNLGHSEPASGLCSISKVVIAMESGFIPPNLHYKSPREGVQALFEGRLKVVTEPTPWEGGLVGVNSFGFGGANCHVLLKSNDKAKINQGIPEDNLPRLVVISGRTEEAVKTLIADVESRPVDAEYVRLLHDIHEEEIPGHLYRGYTLVGKTMKEPVKEIQHFPGAKRPIWFIFSGMGSQWAGMGEALLEIPVFYQAIKKCDAALKPHGLDIFDIITNKDKKTFDNILHSFVGIAAVQIGLVDIMTQLGIVPDNVIGHSVGELGCAYADGCFTAEQMILAAHARGLASIETKLIYGSMAAVGLGYDDVKDLCPPDIDVACHNGPESATISGPAESMTAFVAKLVANKIFAKEVPCSNIAYHSRYIADAGPKLLASLKKVVTNPKPRSAKWLSTSVPQAKWNTPEAKLCSAEYHTNNLLNAVLFEETAMKIPKNAICIEIAPHGLLQAIVRRSLPSTVTNIPLTQRGRNSVEVLLQAAGKMFNVGMHPLLAKFYPDISFPVSRGTPMISPHVRWEHSDDWYVTSYRMQEKIVSGERVVEVSLSDEDFEYMSGHVIDGRNLLPATGYLCLIWETVGMMRGELYTEVPVMFEDVKFLRATNLPKDGNVELTLMIQKGSGRFEVIESGAAVVSGIVHALSHPARERIDPALIPNANESQEMTSKDIYKEFRLRGYHYSGLFRGIKSSSITGKEAMINWSNNYVAFMDNMLQLSLISTDTRGLFVPTGIKKIVIDVKHHMNELREMPEEKCFRAVHIKELDCLACGGVEIRGTKVSAIARKRPLGEPVLEDYKFVAHRDNTKMSLEEIVRLSTHIAYENQLGHKVKTIEYVEDADKINAENLVSPIISEALGDLPLIQAEVGIISPNVENFEEIELTNINLQDSKKLNPEGNTLLAIGHGFLSKGPKIANILSQLLLSLKEGGFVLTREALNFNNYQVARTNGLDIVLEKVTDTERLVLLRKRNKLPKKTIPVMVQNDDLKWIPEVQEIMKSEAEKDYAGSVRVLLIGRGSDNGLLGLVNCLRQEPGGEIIHGLLLQDNSVPEFALQNPFYADQLCQDLIINVFRDSKWGSYRHLKLKPLEPKPAHHVWVNQTIRGDLGSLQWLEGPLTSDFKHDDLVRVYYASLNFRDVMLATGKLAMEVVAKTRLLQECVIGLEFCGIDMKGKRVMGMAENRGLTNLIVCDRFMTWEVPKQWSLEDAATVPVTYGTAYYALYCQGNMRKGDKVLIHSGTGGVGQAAINLALFEGCEVFTTVGTKEKRDFIRKQFPQIPESHIGNSRDTSFEQMILVQTAGDGVDIVLNSLAEEKLQASVRCLSQGGRFLEIGKFDLAANNPLGMEAFLKEISFHGVLLDNVFVSSNEMKQELKDFVQRGLDNGAVKPLVRSVFAKDQLEDAFRFMAAGKHIGKVIVQVREDDSPLTAPSLAYPQVYCREDRSYVVLGGLGGFGLELVDWLVLRGARKIVLTSRAGVKNGYQKQRLSIWESYGTKVVVVSGKDASNRNECMEILKIANNLAPVAGIFNLAVVLKDSIFENQTLENFKESFRPKAWSTKVLDEVSRKYCPKLEMFCVFSSVSCGRGNAGQTNYGMSNSIMERICEKRVADGLPALAVQWGAVGDVGLVAEMQDDHKELVIGGTLQQRISSCLQVLDGFLKQSSPVVASMVVAEKRAGGSGSGSIVNTVLNIMGLKDLKSVSHHTSLAELGMDSMMAVEIKQTLEREFEVFLTAQDIRGLNFAKIIELSAKDEEDKKKSGKAKTGEEVGLFGMQMLYRLVGDQDIVPDVCLKIKTKEEPGRAEVLLIPGIEGLASIYKDIAPQLKSPACCLQLNVTNKQTNLDDIVQHLLPYVKERTKNQRSFTVVGYSFGSMVAIELVRQLENMGKQGRLILLDGSPELMKMIVAQHFAAETVEELQDNMLLGICNVIIPSLCPQLLPEIQKMKTWEEKLNRFTEMIPTEGVPQEFALSAENRKALCTAMYERVLSVQNFDMTNIKPINSPITLLKASAQSVRSINEDFGLQQFTKDKVDIHTVNGNHLTMLDNDRVVAAINGDPLEDAEEFKRRIMEDGKILTPITEINRTEEQQQIY